VIHGVLVWLGLTNGSGHAYLAWSGAGSDIGELAIIGGLATMVRQKNCHVHHCWRLGRHPVAGTPFVVCRKHHPDDHLTAGAVHAAHRNAQEESS
jgi:hypothetical protein